MDKIMKVMKRTPDAWKTTSASFNRSDYNSYSWNKSYRVSHICLRIGGYSSFKTLNSNSDYYRWILK